jgi:hypothetical protein
VTTTSNKNDNKNTSKKAMLSLPLQQLQPLTLPFAPSSLAVSLQHQFFSFLSCSLLFLHFKRLNMKLNFMMAPSPQCPPDTIVSFGEVVNSAAQSVHLLFFPGDLSRSGLHSCQQGLGVSWLGTQDGNQMPDATLVARLIPIPIQRALPLSTVHSRKLSCSSVASRPASKPLTFAQIASRIPNRFWQLLDVSQMERSVSTAPGPVCATSVSTPVNPSSPKISSDFSMILMHVTPFNFPSWQCSPEIFQDCFHLAFQAPWSSILLLGESFKRFLALCIGASCAILVGLRFGNFDAPNWSVQICEWRPHIIQIPLGNDKNST